MNDKAKTARRKPAPRKAGKRLARGNADDYWYSPLGIPNAAKIDVDESVAMTYSAVFRATQIIAGTIATLPLHILRDTGTTRVRERNHPLDRVLNVRANDEMDALTFRELMQGWILNWGNAYAEVQRTVGGHVAAIWPIHPSRVKVERGQDKRLMYSVRDNAGMMRPIPAANLMHVKNMSPDGIVGWSVIRLGAESMGTAIAAERHAGAFFGNGAMPSGVLRYPGRLNDEAAVARIRANFDALYGGANKYHTAILEEGMEYTAMSVNPEDSQLLDSRRYSVAEIARWYGLPPHLLGDLTSATFDNIEHLGTAFLTYSLRYWLAKWDAAIMTQLLDDDEREEGIYAEHVTDALTQADLQTRYGAYKIGREGGWLSANDILRRENRPDIGPQGDVYLIPANMVDAKQVSRQQGDSESGLRRKAHRLWAIVAKKEGNAIRKAAAKPEKFCGWQRDWYEHHAEWTRSTIEPLAIAIGGDAAAWANAWIEASHQELAQIVDNSTCAELAGRIDDMATSLHDRAIDMAELIASKEQTQ
jgi:HK97 family phage portal protein